jgi:hypothetical protein
MAGETCDGQSAMALAMRVHADTVGFEVITQFA